MKPRKLFSGPLAEQFEKLDWAVKVLLNERARQARYHTFKFFALGDCPRCRKIALEQMQREAPEKLEKDRDLRFIKE